MYSQWKNTFNPKNTNKPCGKLKGHGLAKIVEKYLDDFKGFEGSSAYEKLGNGLEETVRNGKLKNVQGVKTIHYKKIQ
ncbi:hypothetical protein [Helicobacter suis]|uniref:putative barnase/colicin E5 family endoribonuclease n=1 Tax=Helicobacter suis TaxID=104628 RepID=UPI003D31EB7B